MAGKTKDAPLECVLSVTKFGALDRLSFEHLLWWMNDLLDINGLNH